MKNPLKNPFFLIGIAFYLVLFVLKKTGFYFPFISDYAADFLALPVVLSITLFLLRKIRPEFKEKKLEWHHILAAVILFGGLFEGLFPLLSAQSTSDPWDLLAYGLGGLFFGIVMQRQI